MYGRSYVSNLSYFVLGMWKFQNQVIQKFYKVFIEICHISYMILAITMIMAIPDIFKKDLPRKGDHIGIVIINVANILKKFLSESEALKMILKGIDESDKTTIEVLGGEARNIYKRSVKKASNIRPFYYLILMVTASSFTFDFYLRLQTYLDEVKVNPNVTEFKEVPILTYEWFPFNTNDHKIVFFIWQATTCYTGIIILGATDLLFLSLIVYCCGELDVLAYVVKNCTQIKENEDENYNHFRYRWCVIEHQKIINYVETLNSTIRIAMLLDFIVRSLQIATVIFQVQKIGFNMMIIFLLVFLTLNVSEVAFYYWHANELTLKSLHLSDAVWQSSWYNQKESTKQLATLMMLRAQKPLAIYIGPLYAMSNQILVQIMKSIYTFLTVINTISEK